MWFQISLPENSSPFDILKLFDDNLPKPFACIFKGMTPP